MVALEADRAVRGGAVTLVLGDVEGSARLSEVDPDAASAALARLDEFLTDAVGRHRGTRPLEQGEGDSFVLAFARPSDAVSCSLDLQLAIAKYTWPGGKTLAVRMAVHTGEVEVREDGRFSGHAFNRCARLRALAHGGQALLSRVAHDLVADSPPPGVTLRDLGEHRLRDLARPERVYQLCHPDLPEDFPPLRSLLALPNNLPLQLTSFIGREPEMREVQTLLREARMLNLTGAGGCGKTRLGLQVAAELVGAFPDGVWWVDLAPLADPALVASALASAVSVREVPGEAPLETLVRKLLDRRLLLVMDNCEHVVGACAALAAALLQGCPGVSVLATSRELLGVEGEVSFRVPSLPFPEARGAPAEEVGGYQAVRLFVERASRARPNFRLTDENAAAIGEICRRLDGIPLAIELSAVRVRMLSPAKIAEGLSHRFRLLTGAARMALPRQRTLEASVDWSYRLLTQPERRLFERLSLFAGGFSLEAAEKVCSGDDLDRYFVFDLLCSLVDKSLVQAEEGLEPRYRLLETVRAFAAQRLDDSGETEAVRTRHLDHYVALASSAEPELDSLPGIARWLPRLKAEADNLRAAMDWALTSGHAEKGLGLAGMWLFWIMQGRYGEIRRRLDDLLGATDLHPVARARGLVAGAAVSVVAGDIAAARSEAEEAVLLARENEDRRALCRGLCWLGWAEFWFGEGSARAHLTEAVGIAREVDDPVGFVYSLAFLGELEGYSGAPSAGRALLEEAIAAQRASGTGRLGAALNFLGQVLLLCGSFAEAQAVLEESLAISRALGDDNFVAGGLIVLAWLPIFTGDYDRARALLHEGLDVARESGAGTFGAVGLCEVGVLEYASGNLRAAVTSLEEALAVSRSVGHPWATATALWALGTAALHLGDRVGARRWLQEAREVAREAHFPWPLGRALLALSRLARAEGDVAGAEDLAHEALRVLAGAEERAGVADCLEALAGLAGAQESFREAARLFGAAERLRAEIGYVRFPVEREGYEAEVAGARAGLGEEECTAAFEKGLKMPTEEAVAYAERGRGERKRPSAGWMSLTPTELEVVRLVARGLPNPEIAARLFVTRNTVKTHLAHIFGKLGITSRAELAAEAARRGISPTPGC